MLRGQKGRTRWPSGQLSGRRWFLLGYQGAGVGGGERREISRQNGGGRGSRRTLGCPGGSTGHLEEHGGGSSWGNVGGKAAPAGHLTIILLDATSSQAGSNVPPKTPDSSWPPSPDSHVSSRRPTCQESPRPCPPHADPEAHTPLLTCTRAPPLTTGRNKKGNLINSFHIQHFPHSIIFKLNNLSLGEKGKFLRGSALPGLTKPTLWALVENVSLEPAPQCPLLYSRSQAAPHAAPACRRPWPTATWPLWGSCQLPGAWGGGPKQLWVE